MDDSVVSMMDIGEILENFPIGISIGIRLRCGTSASNEVGPGKCIYPKTV